MGEYALDDSFVGYDNALNLAAGHGFSFDPGQRVLSTSAPLAVLLYAGISLLNHADIVSIAQVLAAIACLIVGLGGYALVRKFSAPEGALGATVVLLGSPYTLLLWSHESYLCLAMLVVGLLLLEEVHAVGSAIWVGLAALMRPEAILVIPFCTYRLWRTTAKATSLRFAAIAALPIVVWSVFARVYFGSPGSQSIAAKHAELGYNSVGPYLHGIAALPSQVYALGFFQVIPHVLWAALAIVWIVAIVARLSGPVHWSVLAWAAAYTAIYLIVRVPFFIWFATQIGVILALSVAVAWAPRPAGGLDSDVKPIWSAFVKVGRLGALCVAGINLLFLLVATAQPYRLLTFSGTLVMPLIDVSAYKQLGLWLHAHTSSDDSIAYPEIGQLRYYSGRSIIDFEGLVNPGVPSHVERGDTIWAFKEYRPTVYVDNPSWYPFVQPLEYDWFREAYRPSSRLNISMFPYGFTFEVYRLHDGAEVPAADNLDSLATASVVRSTGVYRFSFVPSAAGLDAVDVRMTASASCDHGLMTLRVAGGA